MKALSFIKWTMLLVLGVFTMTSCSDDDDDNEVPNAVKTAFAQKYGSVDNVAWSKNRKGKHVASFMASGKETVAWFEYDGSWIMTKIELGSSLAAVPQCVADAYNMTRYAAEGWTIDEIEEIQRSGESGSIYKIEVEKEGCPDYDLYFSETGVLVDEVIDMDDSDEDDEDYDDEDFDGDEDDWNPSLPTLPNTIAEYIEDKFPGASVVGFDFDDGMYEVAVTKDNETILLYFDVRFSYLRAVYDYTDRIPHFVVEILDRHYAGKVVESCVLVEEKNMDTYYIVELENYDNEILITMDGRFTEIDD